MCRYGLPVNFQAMLLQPNKRNMKKLREVLYDLYKHLDSSAAIIDVSLQKLMEFCFVICCEDDHCHACDSPACGLVWCVCSSFQASMDIPGLNLSQQEYYPYVYYKIDCNLLDFKV